MLTRSHLDRVILKISGKDIRLTGFWEPLPGLPEYTADYARELGISEAALSRCRDIVDVLDLVGEGKTVRTNNSNEPQLL